jgi:predicted MPP superfamily phosphohydrolase
MTGLACVIRRVRVFHYISKAREQRTITGMFVLIALAIWSSMNAYVIWRVVTLPKVAERVPRWAAITAGVVLASSWLVARALESLHIGTVARVLEWIGAQWMGAVLIALACFFIADVITGFGKFIPRHAGAARLIAFTVAVVLTLVAMANALRSPVVREHEVRIRNLPPARDGMVVVAISDLHLGSLTSAEWFEDRVTQVEALHPDLILIAGDLIEGDGPPESEFPRALRALRAPFGVWAVPGNHERHQGAADAVLARAGIRVLRDEAVEAAPALYVAGVDTVGHTHVPGRGLVEKALAHVPPGTATILLSHYPEQVEDASRRGVGLMIAGHTHGGQIWPFGLFVRMAYRYTAGRYEVGAMPLIVCRGTGTWGPRMRLWAPNEMLRIVLRRE